MKAKKITKLLSVIFLTLALAGCTFIFQRGRRSDVQKIEELTRQVDELTQTRRLLEESLNQEIKDKQVRLQMLERGLVITVVGDVLFDSGKATIKPQAENILNKVSKVLKENVPQLNVGIEGHTDNEPIRHSGWKSNWELSTARALSVLHYLVENQGMSPERVSAIGYGEYRPGASNDTKDGRQLNRRVEIVVMPAVSKVQEKPEAQEAVLQEPTENLK
jgi:chemotaxis protein MotB